MTDFKRLWTSTRVALAALVLTVAAGCDSGGGSGEAEGTGTVSMLVTDAPTSFFSEINLTVSRIDLIRNRRGRFNLYNGEATFDLLKLENFSHLFALNSNVPAVEYRAIRLDVTTVELVDHFGNPYYPPILGGGRLDLVPERPFKVTPDSVLVMEIDVDARRSVRFRSGGRGHRWRPVVRVKVGVEEVSHLVRVRGVVDEINLDAGSFKICRVDESNGGITVTDECLSANLADDASIFNPDGVQGVLGDLLSRELVTAVGRFDPTNPMNLDVEVVERDALAAYVTLYGSAMSAPDVNAVFDVTLDPGQDATDDPVVDIQLQPGTRVFHSNGDELDASAIAADRKVESSGVLAPSDTDPDTHWAEWVIVSESEPADALDLLSGFVLFRELDTVTLFTDTGNLCVRVLPDAEIHVVTESSTGTTSAAGSLTDLVGGREVDLEGTTAGDGCFEAQSVVVFVIAD